MARSRSVLVLGRVVLGRDDETPAFPGATVDNLHNVDELLLVLQRPVDLVVVTRPKIDHDVLVSEEEHDGGGVVKLVHGVEVRHLRDIHKVNDGKVLDLVGDVEKALVELHAIRVPIVPEADDDDALLLGQNGLVDSVAAVEVGQHVRHLGLVFLTLPPKSLLESIPQPTVQCDSSCGHRRASAETDAGPPLSVALHSAAWTPEQAAD
mmetsp:Transcript_43079/g.97981  ORF Transcript_43079/g.97981 Transcript_43079/m.97981 type:complete len:208 (+) Transcript_43079:118-741(+)